MKKNLRQKLIIIFLINLCLTSFIYYIYSIRIRDLTKNEINHVADDYIFSDLYFFGTSSEEIWIDSFENSTQIIITNFCEEILKEHEEIFFLFLINSSFLSFEFAIIFKNISINTESREIAQLEIEGVPVTEEEMKIFNLVQEFLNQNRVFTKERVASYIRSRFRVNGNLNYNGIKTVIDSLIKKNLILEGSKLTRKTVLLNTNREIIYNMIIKNPGIYMNKLSKRLKLSPFVIKWHLSMLLKFNLIRKHHLNNNNSYFNSSLDNDNDLFFTIISRDKCIKIIGFLNKNEMGYTKNQIAKALNMHYNTITKYLNEIDKFNLLIKKKVNNIEYITLNNYNFKKLLIES